MASLIYTVFKILICSLTVIFGIFNSDAFKNLCALCWYFFFSLFSFLLNLSYDCFLLFLFRVIILVIFSVGFLFGIFFPIRLQILFQKRTLCLYYTSWQNFHLISCFSNLANRSCKVSQLWHYSTDFLEFFNPIVFLELILENWIYLERVSMKIKD